MMLGFRFSGKLVRIFLCAAAFSACSAFAQDFSTMGLSSVVAVAQNRLQRGEYSAAIPPLEEAISRTKELTDPQKLEILQNCRFQLARALFKTGDSAAGVSVLEDYLKQEPRKKERMALRMMAQGLFDSQNWKQIELVAGRLLDMPDLTKDDRLNANLMLGQAQFQQEKWKACIKARTNKSTDDKAKQVTQVMIVRALVEDENWDELWSWIPRVYRTDSKYDITLNLTVMRAGKARFKQDDSLHALLLYRMVLPREELIDFANGRIAEISKKAGLSELDRKARVKELENIRKLVEELTNLPPYEDEVAFRIGLIYRELKRYWEGYVLFDMLNTKDPDGDIGETSILQLVAILYDLKETARAEERILAYLDERPNGKSARILISTMMRDNLRRETPNPGKVIGLRKYVDGLSPTTDEDELQTTADLHYMMAFGYFMARDYGRSDEQFGEVISDYPNSPVLPDSYYYRGMTHMMQADYQKALDTFENYQGKYEGGEHYSASTFRRAVCLVGLNQTTEAEAVFTEFITAHPDHEFVSEAYSMRGDIEAAKELEDDPETKDVDESATLDRALDDYRKAIEKAVNSGQASYAAFQAAKVYKLEFRWQEIIDLMNEYLNLKKGEANVSEAVFWVGRAQIALGQIDEAVAAYLDAILTFGNDVDQNGVDKIVHELVAIANQRLTDDDRDSLTIKLKLKLTDVDPSAQTLKVRLQMALAYLKGAEASSSLGAELLASQKDLKFVPPIALALMCDAAVEAGDAEEMGRLYDYFTENFEESDDLWHAYRAKTYQFLAKDDLDAAMEIANEALEIYGADTYMGWAQIIKADTLFKQRKYDEAEEAYKLITSVPEWRGPLSAEAMYGMGRCRKASGDLETAHNFFQRTYLLYKAYDDGKWAAEGYLSAAECLLELNREADAIKTWRDMLEEGYVNTLPQAETAKELIKKHGGA